MRKNPYIGRLAPSPTGLLHLGHAATFLTAWQRAQTAAFNSGLPSTLLLRNEDLDPHRSRTEFVDAMIEDLAWLGIRWAPPMVTQSERLPLYRAAFEKMLAAGLAYPCTCSRRELSAQAMLAAPHEDGDALDDEPIYNGKCRPAKPVAATFDASVNYRFRIPESGAVAFEDLNFGAQEFFAAAGGENISTPPVKTFGDFLLWRKGDALSPAGLPSYQLACVVDDAEMRITEVVRGADLLKSAARQILLQRALGLPALDYFHTALLRDENGARLAKRHDALAIRTLREKGLSHEEIFEKINFK